MTRYKHYLLGFAFSAAFSLALADVAKAQILSPDSTSTSSSTSGAASQSGSSSRSNSNATNAGNRQTTTQGLTLNQNSTVPANQTFNSTSNNTNNGSQTNRDIVSGGTNNSNVQSGYTSSDNIVRTTPTVYAPPVSGGNPCTLAVSGGVSVIGWGAAAGGTFVDQDCANRQKIAMVWNSGLKDIAFELMCNDRDTYNAAKSAAQGPKCAYRQAFEPAGAVQPAPQPLPQQLGPTRVTSVQQPAAPFQPAGRFVCLNVAGREVPAGTPGASCGNI